MTQPIPAHWPSEAALIADLKATFPGVTARPAAEYGVPSISHGAWVGGEPMMPDGMPMFSTLVCSDPDFYDGAVHHAFIAWLLHRGWCIEEYDVSAFLITSTAEASDAAAASELLRDLLDQRLDALIVLHRIETHVAKVRLSMSEAARDDASIAQARVEFLYHDARLTELKLDRARCASAPTDDAPF